MNMSDDNACTEGGLMLEDLVMMTITVGFFALAWLYIEACERL